MKDKISITFLQGPIVNTPITYQKETFTEFSFLLLRLPFTIKNEYLFKVMVIVLSIVLLPVLQQFSILLLMPCHVILNEKMS